MLRRITHRKHSATSEPKFSDRQQRIYSFLREQRVGVLSTVTPDGDPHGVVIYYDIDKNFKATFLTRSQTHKYDNLKHRNHVMLTVFDLKTQTTVQITGKAVELTGSDEINKVAGATLATSLKTSDGGLPPSSKLEAGDFVAFRIDPVLIRMAVYARPGHGDYEELFESIESFDLGQQD